VHVYVAFKAFMLFEVWLTRMCVCCEADRERERKEEKCMRETVNRQRAMCGG